MHIYNFNDLDNPRLAQDAKLADVRKNPMFYPSVTTIIKVIPNYFIDEWKANKYIDLARQFPDESYDKIKERAWGYAISPHGEDMKVSDFGTKAHKELEYIFNHDDRADDKWADFLIQAYDEIIDMVEPMETEALIANHELRVAGTIDLIAKKGSKYVLLDYKFRNCEKGSGKFYDSDCYQLSIESLFLKQVYRLNYLPKICSVCICNVTGETYIKWWTQKKLDNGIENFLNARDLYFSINNLEIK
tara:strand:+ start:393 stop:1130 length:738 start_codon:yes stop_codon:yes gene_type:complete